MTTRFGLRSSLALFALSAFGSLAHGQCELARLIAGDAQERDELGKAVSIFGAFGFVGAAGVDDQGMESGAVYVAQRVAGSWSLTDKLVASGGMTGTRFGRSVSVDGDLAIVGAPGTAAYGAAVPSAVYVFERGPAGWTEVDKFVGGDTVIGDGFGGSVGLDGDHAVIGAAGHQGGGTAYVFERGPSGWVEVAKLLGANPDDSFGKAVAIFDGTAVVGASGHDEHGFESKGAVHVFERSSGWSQGIRVSLYEGTDYDRLGWSVDVHRDRFIAGAWREQSANGTYGAAHVFKRAPGGWVHEARLWPPYPPHIINFGDSVALSGDKALIGSGVTNRVYIYKRTSLGWRYEDAFGGSVQPQRSAFGMSLAVSGDQVMVGAPGGGDICNSHNCSSGAAFVFTASLQSSRNICATAANSTGEPALISLAGCTRVSLNSVDLTARPVPAGTPGIFFYGDRRIDRIPFGDGFRCVGGRVFRLPLTPASSDEVLSWDLDLTSPPQATGQITAGTTWHFQAYYRDPAAGGAGFNLSDGLEVLFPN